LPRRCADRKLADLDAVDTKIETRKEITARCRRRKRRPHPSNSATTEDIPSLGVSVWNGGERD
jgi:hypothetical protein